MTNLKKTNNINHMNRLKWACRRGMLELDVLLGDFLEACYPKLTQEEQALFEQLLKCEDQALYQWLLGGSQPEDIHLLKMTEMIRRHARS